MQEAGKGPGSRGSIRSIPCLLADLSVCLFLRYGIMMEWYQELGGCVLYPGPAFSILEDELTDAEKAEIARNAYQADQ